MISPVKVWRNQSIITKTLGKQGKIVSWTIIRAGPIGFEAQIPYPVVVVELENKERMVGQLVDWEKEDLVAGKAVEAVLRRIREPDREGVIPYGIKFRPILGTSH